MDNHWTHSDLFVEKKKNFSISKLVNLYLIIMSLM